MPACTKAPHHTDEKPAWYNAETGEEFTECNLKSSPLHVAAMRNDSKKVEELVKSGADINLLCMTIPPLYISVRHRDIKTIKTFIKLKCDINARTLELQHSPLHAAVCEGYIDVCRLLLDNGADINQSDQDGATPLMIAASTGKLDLVKFLVQRGADLDKPLKRKLTPLAAAVQNGHTEIVDHLLQSGAQVDLVDNKGNNALFHAVKGGQVRICRILINGGVSVNHCNKAHEYLIGIAAMHGNSAIMDLLIVANCDVNAVSPYGTPVYSAVERQHLNVLKKLIAAGADVGKNPPGFRLPLVEALHQHTPNYDVILELLKAGADIDSAVCDCHDSPIKMVLSKCKIKIVTILIQVNSKLGNIPESKLDEMKVYCPATYRQIRQQLDNGAISLKGLCRKTTKRSIGCSHYKQKVAELPIPSALKRYLLHEDLLSPEEFSSEGAVSKHFALSASKAQPVKPPSSTARSRFRVPLNLRS